MDGLRVPGPCRVLESTLALADGGRPGDASSSAAATAALRAAGFEDAEEWRDRARAKLRAYVRVVAEAPRGISLEVRLGQARVLFEAGLYFEVHEVLEPAWLTAQGEAKRWLQGVIQAAVAWHHDAAGNRVGAASLSLSGAEKLADAPAEWHGFPLRAVASAVTLFADWLAGGETGPPPSGPFTPSEPAQ